MKTQIPVTLTIKIFKLFSTVNVIWEWNSYATPHTLDNLHIIRDFFIYLFIFKFRSLRCWIENKTKTPFLV